MYSAVSDRNYANNRMLIIAMAAYKKYGIIIDQQSRVAFLVDIKQQSS